MKTKSNIAPSSSLGLCALALRRALRWSPGWFLALIVVNVALAVLPALQVLCVNWMATSLLYRGDGTLAIIVITAACIGSTYLLSGLLADVSQSFRSVLQTHFSCELRRSISQFKPSELASEEVSQEVQAARSAVDYMLNGLPANVIHVLCAILTGASLLAVVWRFSPVSAVLVVASLLPLMVKYHLLSGVRRRVIIDMSDNQRSERYFTDQLVYQRSATELAALGASGRMAAWGDAPAFKNNDIAVKFGWISMIADVISSLTVILFVFGALAALVATRDPAAASAGIVGVISGIGATHETGAALGQIILAVPQMEKWQRVISRVQPVGAAAPRPTGEVLACRHVAVRYLGCDTDILSDVSLDVRRGEIAAIVGKNGSGKTTLVNAIIGTLPLADGQITLDGTDLSTISETTRVACFGFLTQEFGRYELTIRRNLLLGTPDGDVSDERLWAALEQARAADFVKELPYGLDTQLGQQWGGVGISGGQWQRLALARIYLRNAAIWVLDEPTSAVDVQSEAEIFSQLADDKSAHMTLVISHRVSTLKKMDKIYFVENGRIVQSGTYPELCRADGPFRRLFAEET